MGAHSLLVVEDDAVIRRSLARWIRQTSEFEVIEADSVESGMEALEREPVAAIVDVGLPDGDGLDLVAKIRERLPQASVLVTTASDAATHANRAHLLGASIARKPAIDSNVTLFLSQATRNSNAQPNRERAVAMLSATARFSPQQRRIVELMASGTKRSELAKELSVEESTVRTHVRAILTRVGVDNLDRVAWKLLELLDKQKDPQ